MLIYKSQSIMKQILFLTFVLIAVSLSAQLRRVDHTQDPKASENTRSNLPFSAKQSLQSLRRTSM
jgi:hypothetical protein